MGKMSSNLLALLFTRLYGIRNAHIRSILISLCKKVEHGEMYSNSLRMIFAKFYGVEIGKYSYGGCFIPLSFNPNTRVGNYCSIAKTVCVFNRNHPLESASMHPFFYNSKLGLLKDDCIEYKKILIEDDVWMGHNSIVTPSVNLLGRGSIIAAGAVVTKDVPRYAIVAGNPAKIIRYRFNDNQIRFLEDLRWWDEPIEVLKDKYAQIESELRALATRGES